MFKRRIKRLKDLLDNEELIVLIGASYPMTDPCLFDGKEIMGHTWTDDMIRIHELIKHYRISKSTVSHIFHDNINCLQSSEDKDINIHVVNQFNKLKDMQNAITPIMNKLNVLL